MAHVLNVRPPYPTLRRPSPAPPRTRRHPSLPALYSSGDPLDGNPNPRWTMLQEKLRCGGGGGGGRHSCFFYDGRKQDQARKALESALDGKKSEFEKWNKEVEQREERSQGGGSGKGGWFGGGRGWFGWFEGEHFWEEAQQAILTVLAIISFFLLLTKGNAMFAIIINPLLYVLRGARTWFASVSLHLFGRAYIPAVVSEAGSDQKATGVHQQPMSAKERVLRKWGMD